MELYHTNYERISDIDHIRPPMSANGLRLTGTSYAVLSLIRVLGPSTPYELKQALEKSIANFWPVPHTTFYAEPDRLASAGLLSVEQEPAGRRRKLYSLTPAGEEGILKIFSGADPAPIMRQRREWHMAKLAELEGYLAIAGDDPGYRGVRTSLEFGVAYERMLVDAIEQFLAGDGGRAQAATGSS